MALDTSTEEEGIWISAQAPSGSHSSFSKPEMAYGGDVSLVVYINLQTSEDSEVEYSLQDTLIYPW